MHRALSAENLAEFARGTINGLKRFIPGREVGDDSLAAAVKAVEERCLRGNKPQMQHITLMLEHFCDEVRFIQQPAEAATTPQQQTEGTTPAKPRKVPEQAIVQFFDVLRVSYRLVGPPMIPALVDTHATHAILFLICDAPVSRKVYDAAFLAFCDFIVDAPSMFIDISETLHMKIFKFAEASAKELPTTDAAVGALKAMHLIVHAFRKGDIISIAHTNEVKSKFAMLGTIDTLLNVATVMKENCAQADGASRQDLLACGTLALATINGLIRSNVPNKDDIMSNPKRFGELWVFYATSLSKLECTFTVKNSLPGSAKAESVTMAFENTSSWAADLVECLIEVSTRDSFSLHRQALYSDLGPIAHHNQASTPDSFQPGLTAAPDAYAVTRKWETLPLNWDAVLASGAVFVWKLASATHGCILSKATCELLLHCLMQLDVTSNLPQFTYRAIVASLLLLCRANPTNTTILTSSGAFDVIVSMMTSTNSVLRQPRVDGAPEVLVSLSLNHPAWPITVALLSAIVSTQCGAEQLKALMGSVEAMVSTTDITPEDCEILEHCFHVLSTSVYAKDSLWFDGRTSAVVCPVDRFCGRWYGYSFLTWINVPCVWSEGCHLFSYSEPTTPSKTVVSVVANGRSRCLSVRSTNNKELTIALLPEATIGDGWNHIAIVHNISGFTVFVNGKKCCTNSSVPYPKEPAKGQRLQFCIGGGDPGIPPLLGMMTTTQMVDKDMGDRDVERLFQAGPGSCTTSIEPAVQAGELIRVDCSAGVAVSGSLVKDDVDAQEVSYHEVPDVPAIMEAANLVEWGTKLMESTTEHPENRGSVVVLCLELLSAYVKQCDDGFNKMQQSGFIEAVGKQLLRWDNVPPVFPGVLLSLVTQKQNPKLLRQHPVTAKVLVLLLDIISGACPTVTRCATLKEFSDMLSVPPNAKLFRESPKLLSILELSRHVEPECMDDLVSVAEKLVKEQAEMETAFKFLLAEPSTKQSTIVKCELTRMLYDIGVAALSTVDIMIAAGGVSAATQLVAGYNHSSEALRVYSLRLLALFMHCNKKQRDLFLKNNGFEQIAVAIENHAGSTPLRVSTFNCLFKFALDYFQPNTADSNPASAPVQAARTHQDPRAMAGHMPSLLPQRNAMRRTYSMGSIGSECSDIEARLSIDDTYQSQSNKTRDTVVYPHCIAVTISLLKTLIESQIGENGCDLHMEQSTDGGTSDIPESSSTSSKRDCTEHDVVVKVLSYLERIVDMPQNAIALTPHPWMEWLWVTLSRPLADEGYRARNRSFVKKVEVGVRNIVRKIAVVDLSRQSRQSFIRKMKDYVDAPQLQRIVMEEIVRHFSSNNRLDVMDGADANNVLKNLDALLTGLDEAISPFPLSLGLEVIQAIGMIAGQNNAWVRNKMKNGKYFETRKNLSFFVLTATRTFSRETQAYIHDVLEVNMHEPNTTLYMLKLVVDTVKDKNVEEVEVLQNMLRTLYSMDDDQRRTMNKVLGEQEIVDLIISQRRVVDGAEVEVENLVSWTLANDSKWDQAVQKIARAAKAIETEVAAKNERREKERAARTKNRKLEVERRSQVMSKLTVDLERTRSDVESRFVATYADIIGEISQQRSVRLQ